jgi:hypothetical protein
VIGGHGPPYGIQKCSRLWVPIDSMPSIFFAPFVPFCG